MGSAFSVYATIKRLGDVNRKQNQCYLPHPLTLDLNSDEAISTTNLENGVYFNHNGDKIAFKTTWNYQ